MTQHQQDPEDPAQDLTLSEVADLLRVRRRDVLVALLRHRLPCRRRGLRVVVPRRELLAEFGATGAGDRS